MGVALRKKTNSDNTTSLYLDIYHSGKRSYEFLKQLKLITKPSNPIERADNKKSIELAKKILAKRQHELESNDYDITPQFKQNIDFMEFFTSFRDNYKKKDLRVLKASYNQFEKYLKQQNIKSLTAKQVTESLVNGFRDYLLENLNGDSPSNYLKKFKLAIREAMRQNIIIKDPSADVRIKLKTGIRKQVLTPEEIQKLVNTPVTNNELRRAFIFSLYTGLRWSDIITIKWQNVDFNNNMISVTQEKTKERVDINLHPTALKALGKPKKATEHIFNLPSHTGTAKGLKYWVKKAGINKNITWHCARHSFATNIIFFGADFNTASKLLGHTSIRYTQRYTHIVASLKDKAVSNLPEADF